MMDWLPRKPARRFRVRIEPLGCDIPVEAGETLLQAALTAGIKFPNSCRVGSCGTCKCLLLSGNIKSMTDTSYVLDPAEINAGYILACQSVLKSDIHVSIEKRRGER